jgi:hypothetical protein
MRNYYSGIVGFNRTMGKEANELYRILNQADWDGFLKQVNTITNSDDIFYNIEFFVLRLLLEWSLQTTILNISKITINHNINILVNAIKSQIKDKSILDSFIADQKHELRFLTETYLDTVDMQQLKLNLAKSLANKVQDEQQLPSKRSVEKSLWGTLGVVVPVIAGLTYWKATTGSIKNYKVPDYFVDIDKIDFETALIKSPKLVIANQWNVARPLDFDCYSATGEVREIGKKFSNGVYAPPVHANCWLDGQNVLTKTGWKLVQDITLQDQVFTLDDNYNTTFAYPVAVWHKKVNEIIMCQGKTARFAFTPDHKMIEVSYHNCKYNKDKRAYKYTEIGSFHNSAYNLLQSAYNDKADLGISDCEIRFLAWYIGEGSKGIYRNWKKKQIFIAQDIKSPVRNIFESDIKAFMSIFDPTAKLWIGKNGIEIRSDCLFDWLPVGKSIERQCPERLLYMSKRQSRLFIETYALGDGYTQRDTYFDSYKCNDSISLYTSSQNMLAAISMIAQNAEWNVSYTCKGGCWNIKIKTSRNYYLETNKLERLNGEFNVTGIQLEHGNKILSSMDGRCIWTHNCLCTLKPYLVSKKGINALIKKYSK